jgi:hypothetical protein
MSTHYFDCQCTAAEHTLRFVMDDDDGTLYTEVHLRKEPLLKRLVNAVKYICGFTCKYGYFDCTILRPDEYNKLTDLLSQSKQIMERNANAKN